jgi:hypothetical protein
MLLGHIDIEECKKMSEMALPIGNVRFLQGGIAASGRQIGHINEGMGSSEQGDIIKGCELLIAYPEFSLHVFDVFVSLLDIQNPELVVLLTGNPLGLYVFRGI